MAECPKCGRQLSASGACPSCGSSVSAQKAKWYALAEESDAEEQRQVDKEKKGPRRAPKAAGSAKRSQWYEAAGMEAPVEEAPPAEEDPAAGQRFMEDAEVNPDAAMIQVTAGRKDPPFKLIGIGVGFLLMCGVIAWRVVATNREEAAEAAQQAAEALPKKNIIVERSYGYRVVPPDGFKQSVVPEPEWLHGTHGEYTSMTYFKSAKDEVEAYYFAEQKKSGTLDEYAKLVAESLGKATAIPTIPEGMGKNPTKGYLLDMGDKKALAYVASASQNRFISVYAVAPKASFDQAQAAVEAAIRAFTIEEPSGPHPDKEFAPPPKPPED